MHSAVAQLQAQLFAHSFGKFGIGVTAEDFDVFTGSNHRLKYLVLSSISACGHTTSHSKTHYSPTPTEMQHKSKRKTNKKAEIFFADLYEIPQ